MAHIKKNPNFKIANLYDESSHIYHPIQFYMVQTFFMLLQKNQCSVILSEIMGRKFL